MKITKLISLLVLLPVLFSCDIIPQDERTVAMQQIVPQKKVLLLDFTDQRCPNCPKAGIELERLVEVYGDNLVAVTMHASKLPNLPLVTAEAKEYDTHFGANITGHPAGVIDGMPPEVNYNSWDAILRQQFNKTADAEISLAAVITGDELHLTANIAAASLPATAKLLVWLVEDNVVSWQLQPDGSTIVNDYLHHHILRAALNGVWGEPVTLEAGLCQKQYDCSLKTEYNYPELSLVALLYDSDTDRTLAVEQIKPE